MKKIKDMVLIRGIKNGNKKHEKLLYDKYKIRVEKFLKYNYPFDKEIDDNVSEILIKIFENLNQYDSSKSKFVTWVNNVAKNYMIDKSRKEINDPIQVTFDSANDGTLCFFNTNDVYCDTSNVSVGITTNTSYTPCSSYISPDKDMENKDALSFISDKIGIKDFHLLNMKYNEGYDYNEMEKELKMSSSTISNRVNYVRSKLRKK